MWGFRKTRDTTPPRKLTCSFCLREIEEKDDRAGASNVWRTVSFNEKHEPGYHDKIVCRRCFNASPSIREEIKQVHDEIERRATAAKKERRRLADEECTKWFRETRAALLEAANRTGQPARARPPIEILKSEGGAVYMCSCGAQNWTMQGFYDCWSKGHYDLIVNPGELPQP
jgi:hypothetical protein